MKAEDKPLNRRQLDADLDKFEGDLSRLRVLYEQHFLDILPQPPDKERKEIVAAIRQMLRSPFKTAAVKFRLKSLVTRYQTYATYWERVIKQREEGTYDKDRFKAELREKMLENSAKTTSPRNKAEQGIVSLFNSYEDALRKTGAAPKNLNYETFKKSLIDKAKHYKQEHGTNKLHFKVAVRDGKVIIRATPKE